MDTKRTGRTIRISERRAYYYPEAVESERRTQAAGKKNSARNGKAPQQTVHPFLHYRKNEEAGKQVLTAVQEFLFPDGRFCGKPLINGSRRMAS